MPLSDITLLQVCPGTQAVLDACAASLSDVTALVPAQRPRTIHCRKCTRTFLDRDEFLEHKRTAHPPAQPKVRAHPSLVTNFHGFLPGKRSLVATSLYQKQAKVQIALSCSNFRQGVFVISFSLWASLFATLQARSPLDWVPSRSDQTLATHSPPTAPGR